MNKVEIFNGTEFYLGDDGYYRDKNYNYLHRCIWEYYNCSIPEGYEIHHIDLDKSNNDISNLRLLKASDHKKLHADLLTPEQRDWRRNNMNTVVHEAAKKWHQSEEGSAWHTKHIQEQHQNGSFKKELICTNCGKHFIGEKKGENTFCSNACKSAYRRKMGLDNIKKVCPICGNEFETSKYKKVETCSRSCANRMRAKKNQEWVDYLKKGLF